MLRLVALLAAMQGSVVLVQAQPVDSVPPQRSSIPRDTAAERIKRDSLRAERRRAQVIPVTPQLLANAYHDQDARALVARARQVRLEQDSALASYDATTYERLSIEGRIGTLGFKRLLLRSERAARVQWSREQGVNVNVTGVRNTIPMANKAKVDVHVQGDVPVPYFPGRETLLVGSGLARANVTDGDVVHPLAAGAEAYYTYATGSTATFQLPGGRQLVVRELHVRPRTSRWNLVVGSLWFDSESGQVVRAVYRLAESIDIERESQQTGEPDPAKELPFWLRPILLPMTASIDVVTVDYGLYEGRFWLPRTQTLEGMARLGVLRVPVTAGQHFEYSVVNGNIEWEGFTIVPDTMRKDTARARYPTLTLNACDPKRQRGYHIMMGTQYDGTLPFLRRVPCNDSLLAISPTLPPSAYSSVDSLFADSERSRFIAEALGMGNQAGRMIGKPVTVAGLREMRYNRVEGLSLGARVSRPLGGGFQSQLSVRFETASAQPNAEWALSQTNGRETRTFAVYRRLAVSNDWGRRPFGLGASLSALLFGRDEGMYYRAWGAEVIGEREGWVVDQWRLFSEQQWHAPLKSTFSLARAMGGDRFAFDPNIVARKGTITGLELRRRGALGENPDAVRLTSDVRVEGGVGTFDYARGMAEVIASVPLGPLATSWTFAGGYSGGTLPPQRHWYLGGLHTLPGQPLGVLAGDAYWLTRLETGTRPAPVRALVFGTLGWAGARDQMTKNAKPAGSAGAGFSFLDGLLRFDVAKGIRPSQKIGAYLYFDARL